MFDFCLAATRLDPSLKWKTLETSHFSIHFYEAEEEVAKRLSYIAEEVHAKLVPILKHEPEMKTHVVLLDTVDYGNGMANVFPYPMVTLYLTDWSTNLNPSKFDDWLRFLFVHEYTHILHLDIVEGGPELLKLIFGRVIFPNALSPAFILEGMATYSETKNTQWGRGWDPRWDMMMRMEVLENNIKSIDQASVYSLRWPIGNIRYLYGVEFLEYLSETYGEDKLVSLIHHYGNFLFSHGVDGAFIFVYKKKLSTLWYEWLDHLRDKYKKQEEGLGEITKPHLATNVGYYNLKPKWAKDSKRIFYQQNGADGYASIMAYDLENKETTSIFEGSVFFANLSLGPTGKEILFVKSDTFKNYYTYKDLYIYNLSEKKMQRLTEGKRIVDADFSPDGTQIVFVKNELGTKRLMLMDREGENVRSLGGYEANVQYFSPRWSPNGNSVVVAKWIPGGEQKIYLIDPETGEQERLTSDMDLVSEANPCFSPDGDYVFFDSDRTGIVNLYAFHLESEGLFQITNVLGGAMMPDVSPDGKKVAYVSYSSKGYDIAVMEVKPFEWMEAGESLDLDEFRNPPAMNHVSSLPAGKAGTNNETSIEAATEYTDIHDYNPVPSLLPKFWFPITYTNENGSQTYIYTQGYDVLNKHLYEVAYGYDWDAARSQYSLLYANNQFLPQIVFQLADAAVPYSWDSSTLWMQEKTGMAYLSFYDNRVFSEWDEQILSLGYQHININNISSIESLTTPPSLGNLNALFIAWRYISARQYLKSISPEDGVDITLQVTMNSRDLGSDYSNTNYSLDAATYFSTPGPHHVLAPTLYGFYSQGEQLAQSNYSWKYLPMRGYPSTNMRGNKGILLSTEYRFPWLYPEIGVLYGGTYFDKVWWDLFFEVGGATSDLLSNLSLKRSYGLEFNLDTLFVGYYDVTLKLGYAKGLDKDGEEKAYFTIGL